MLLRLKSRQGQYDIGPEAALSQGIISCKQVMPSHLALALKTLSLDCHATTNVRHTETNKTRTEEFFEVPTARLVGRWFPRLRYRHPAVFLRPEVESGPACAVLSNYSLTVFQPPREAYVHQGCYARVLCTTHFFNAVPLAWKYFLAERVAQVQVRARHHAA